MGRIETGSLEVGQKITVYPSGLGATVTGIYLGSTSVQRAEAPASVTVTFANELDVQRGDLIADPYRAPQLARRLAVDLVWLDRTPLDLKRPYLVKHMTRTHQARMESLDNLLDVTTLATLEAEGQLATNEIGRVVVRLANDVPFDPYAENRATGALVLIDPASNSTVAGGIIREAA
jgi:sulfate adenylyltransferase subunit 1 (EFTu-like GTPase family)